MPTPSILKEECGLPRLPSFLSKNAVYPDSLHSCLSSLWFPGVHAGFLLARNVLRQGGAHLQSQHSEAWGRRTSSSSRVARVTCWDLSQNKQTNPNKLRWKLNVLEQSCFYCFSEHLDRVAALPFCSWPCSGTQRLLSPLSLNHRTTIFCRDSFSSYTIIVPWDSVHSPPSRAAEVWCEA